MNKTLAAAVVAASALGAGAASAATFTFDLTGPSNGSFFPSYSQTESGLTVTATAGGYLFDTIVSTTGRTVTQNGNGLGVDCIVLPGLCDNQINGITADLLTLSFGWAVKLVSITFGNVGSGDDVDIFVDGGLQFADANLNGPGNNPFSLGLDGTSFSFGADALNDNFRVASITVSSVPLPASALLLLAGLAGLGAMARRRAT